MSEHPLRAEGPADWSPSPDATVVRTLSIVGIVCGDPDLAARSQEILWRELGLRPALGTGIRDPPMSDPVRIVGGAQSQAPAY